MFSTCSPHFNHMHSPPLASPPLETKRQRDKDDKDDKDDKNDKNKVQK